MRPTVDAAGHTAHDDDPGRGKLAAEHACNERAVRRTRTSTDDGNGRPLQELRLAVPAQIEPPGRIVDRAQAAAAAPLLRSNVTAKLGGAR
jgi:hypothetical protein